MMVVTRTLPLLKTVPVETNIPVHVINMKNKTFIFNLLALMLLLNLSIFVFSLSFTLLISVSLVYFGSFPFDWNIEILS